MNNPICPCVFVKKTISEFIIIVFYVNDLNISGTHKEILQAMMYLKEEFEMKDLRETKYCIGLQIEHFKVKYFCINQTILIRS